MYEIHQLTRNKPMSFHAHVFPSDGYFTPHWHENIEILYIEKGSAKAILDGEEVHVNRGEIIVVNSNTIHQLFPVSGDFFYYCLIINLEFLEQLGLDFAETTVQNCVHDNEIARLFSHIFELYQSKIDLYIPDSYADTIKIATILMRHYKDGTKAKAVSKKNAKKEMVKQALVYMKKHYDSNLTLEDMCRAIGFTKCYFCHTFKEVTGVSAITMLHFIRCQEAKQMLAESESSVQEVAFACGFKDVSYFTKTYKTIIGQLPSETKKNSK